MTAHRFKCEAKDDCIACENCGERTSDWDWSASYDRFCLKCLAKAKDGWDYDPRADLGCHEFHQNR